MLRRHSRVPWVRDAAWSCGGTSVIRSCYGSEAVMWLSDISVGIRRRCGSGENDKIAQELDGLLAADTTSITPQNRGGVAPFVIARTTCACAQQCGYFRVAD